MKTEVKNTKKFWRRGNVIDIVILLLLVAAIASVVLRYYQTQSDEQDLNARNVRIGFVVEDTLPGIASAATIGEMVYLSDGTAFGKLEAHPHAADPCPFAVSAAQMLLQNADGHYVNATLGGGSLVDLQGLLTCTGIYDEQGAFLLGGHYSISPGQRVAVVTEQTAFVLCITDIETLR
jgi:hypothetical protein